MASHLVGQNQIATFITPVNGTSPIDANQVRGNDNSIKTAYNGHDLDPTLHIQDSLLVARPLAGVEGRKWMTTDPGLIRLWYDNGVSWQDLNYLSPSGGALSGALTITSAPPQLTLAFDPTHTVQLGVASDGVMTLYNTTGGAAGASPGFVFQSPVSIAAPSTFTASGPATFAGPTTLSGVTTLSTTVVASLAISGLAGTSRILAWQTAGVNRWQASANSTAESGADAGSNFILSAYTDAGVLIDTAFFITRAANGSVSIARPTLAVGTSTLAVGAMVSINAAAGVTRDFRFQTAGVLRWNLRSDSSAEGGADAGSGFQLNAYSDAGAFLDTPISVGRAITGTVSLARAGIILGGPTLAGTSIYIRGLTGSTRQILFQTAALSRWSLSVTSTAEGGADAGSAFALTAFDDSGTTIDAPISIQRALAGFITFSRNITQNAVQALMVQGATTADLYVGSGTGSSTSAVNIRSAAGQFSLLQFRTANNNRWTLGKNNTAEGGSNAGSNFAINAYDDGGVFIDSPMTMNRAAGGAISFNRPTTVNTTFTATGSVTITGATGTTKQVILQTGGLNRWAIQSTSSAETGGNAGSPLSILAYDDAGAFIDTTLTIVRAAAGLFQIFRNLQVLPTAGGTVATFGLTTEAVQTAINVRGAAGAVRDIQFLTANTTRWTVRVDSSAEGGSDAGSAFQIVARNDAGSIIDTPISIVRAAAGAISFFRPLTFNQPVTAQSSINIAGAAGTSRSLNFYTSATRRWSVEASSAAEGGSDAGSAFNVNAFNDAGTFIDTPISIVRAAAGAIQFTRPVTATATVSMTGATTILGSSGLASILALALRTAAGNARDILFQSGTVNRWGIRANATAEGGSDAGSDFQLQAYTDAGALIDTPIAITRAAAGAMTFTRSITATATQFTFGPGGAGGTITNFNIDGGNAVGGQVGINFNRGGTARGAVAIAGTVGGVVTGSAIDDMGIRVYGNHVLWFSGDGGATASMKIDPTGIFTVGCAVQATPQINIDSLAGANQRPALQLLRAGSLKGVIAIAGSAGDLTASSAINDVVIRASGGSILFTIDGGATSPVIIQANGLRSNYGDALAALLSNNSNTQYTLEVWNLFATGDNKWVTFNEGAGGTLRGTIDFNRAGTLTRYNTSSDYRLKELYGAYVDAGIAIDAVTVHAGRFKVGTMVRPMFVAHEIQPYAPWAVSGVKDGPEMQQLDHSSLVPILWAEVKSLRARVAALEN
jgi:hypothetical protein